MKDVFPRKLKEHNIKVNPLGILLFIICILKDTVFLLYAFQTRKKRQDCVLKNWLRALSVLNECSKLIPKSH